MLKSLFLEILQRRVEENGKASIAPLSRQVELERRINSIPFHDPSILQTALKPQTDYGWGDQRRLAAIGDGLIGARLNNFIRLHYPRHHPGRKRWTHWFLSNHYLETVVRQLELDQFMEGPENPDTHAYGTFYEALVGAMSINDGERGPTAFIYRTILLPAAARIERQTDLEVLTTPRDPRWDLTNITLRLFKTVPTYKRVGDYFPRGDRRISVGVHLSNGYHCLGWGRTSEQAKISAAREMIGFLGRSVLPRQENEVVQAILAQYRQPKAVIPAL